MPVAAIAISVIFVLGFVSCSWKVLDDIWWLKAQITESGAQYRLSEKARAEIRASIALHPIYWFKELFSQDPTPTSGDVEKGAGNQPFDEFLSVTHALSQRKNVRFSPSETKHQ